MNNNNDNKPKSVKTDAPGALIMERVKREGIANIVVSDGHLWIFKRSFLEDLLKRTSNQDTLIVHIKNSEFDN